MAISKWSGLGVGCDPLGSGTTWMSRTTSDLKGEILGAAMIRSYRLRLSMTGSPILRGVFGMIPTALSLRHIGDSRILYALVQTSVTTMRQRVLLAFSLLPS